MIREYLMEKKRQRYFDSMENINNDIFSSNQRKLWAIKSAADFENPEELELIIREAEDALNYFLGLHKENITRLQSLKENKQANDHKLVELKHKEN